MQCWFSGLGKKIIINTALKENVEKASKSELLFIKEIESFDNFKCSHPFKDSGYDFDIPLLEGDFLTEDAPVRIGAVDAEIPADCEALINLSSKAIPRPDRFKRLLTRMTLPYPGRFRMAARTGRFVKPLARWLPPTLRVMLGLLPDRLPARQTWDAVYPAVGTKKIIFLSSFSTSNESRCQTNYGLRKIRKVSLTSYRRCKKTYHKKYCL